MTFTVLLDVNGVLALPQKSTTSHRNIAQKNTFDFFILDTENSTKSAAIILPRKGQKFFVDLGECLIILDELSAP